MRIKICGITRLEDALCAIRHGADAIGFIFYKKSQRYIEPQKVKAIVDALPPYIDKVGVFVEESGEEIDAICRYCGLSSAQIYLDTYKSEMPQTPYLGVIRVKCKEDLKNLPEDKYFLVDTFVEQYGGEGARTALEWYKGIDCSKLVIAGGIDAENIYELRGFGFYGIDISSGVESAKGIKDCGKIEAFMKKAKTL